MQEWIPLAFIINAQRMTCTSYGIINGFNVLSYTNTRYSYDYTNK